MTESLEPEQLAELDSIAGGGDATAPGPGSEPGGEPAGIDAGPAPAPVQPPGPPTSELLAPVVALAFAGLAPAWNVSEGEQAGLCEAYGALIDKWWPGGLSNYGPEFNALLITAAVFMPRMKQPRQLEPEPGGAPEPGGDDGAPYTVEPDALKADEPGQ